MTTLLDRFLRYVRIDTQADETSDTSPSTSKQLTLSRLLAEECEAIGLADVSCDKFGNVMATIPATVDHDAPVIVWVAHVDTSPEFTAENVKPIVHENYSGGDIVLPGDSTQVIRVDDNPVLRELIGSTIITTDGTTLLGADDKAGVAVIMTAAAWLICDNTLPRGPVRVCFTCDEEIGRGTENLDLKKLGGVCGYTLDGEGRGMIDNETFSADQAVITVTGVNTHPSKGKGVMVNAIRILSRYIAAMPTDWLSPETTDDRNGFLHPYVFEGGVAQSTARIILRDFDTAKLAEYAELLEEIAEPLREEFPEAKIDVAISQQYRNMADGLKTEPRAVAKAVEAMQAVGIDPLLSIIRGGTDGSLLTEQGLPTPNLSTGQHNPHSPREWASLDEMQTAADVLIKLAEAWSTERV
ncbi:Peptidase T [Symmachiella macrocystis]|uniref:Peptidase T n=1 Tax=Symmachiella macrocystis TaxID=2527985 RepID=A0A5C6BH90_9PLAN|nr:peptidase T [Symmachiella macrocystis]TWU11320.1 Peptidase T [Symmachiella macrocystis]